MAFVANRRLWVFIGVTVGSLLGSACSEHAPPDSSPPPAVAAPETSVRSDSSPPPVETYSANAQVQQLKELRDKGLITEVEFQQKKRKLLERQ